MGRFPRLRFSVADLDPIHAVYLSHAHCDHLDPYTLLRLWQQLPSPPALILPVSLSFLIPTLQAHLDEPEIMVLPEHHAVSFRGLDLLGFYDVGFDANNEEDVMILVVTHGAERVLIEADARLSLELPRFREYVSMLLRGPGIDSAVYLTTENELTGTLEGRGCQSVEDREILQGIAFDEMLDAVHQLYVPSDEPMDLWQGDRVLRLIHGQGLTAPHELDPRWQQILFPVRIADRVRAERATAAENGLRHRIDALTVGCVHTVVNGEVTQREPAPWLTLLDEEAKRRFAVSLPFFPPLGCAPLRADVRDRDVQRERIRALLNVRFLPYLHGLRQPSVLHLLATYGGAYRVRVYFGHTLEDAGWDYVLSYGGRDFVEGVAEPDVFAQEAYWANDLEDFLDGQCDEFTPFCRTQLPAEQMRLWASLATPLLNSDLVIKRVEHHFQRAQQGLDPGSWVTMLYPEIGKK